VRATKHHRAFSGCEKLKPSENGGWQKKPSVSSNRWEKRTSLNIHLVPAAVIVNLLLAAKMGFLASQRAVYGG
jgi:hypothetical protein